MVGGWPHFALPGSAIYCTSVTQVLGQRGTASENSMFVLFLELLQRYNDEASQVERLREQVNQLQQKLQVLTKSFERASQSCYKTP